VGGCIITHVTTWPIRHIHDTYMHRQRAKVLPLNEPMYVISHVGNLTEDNSSVSVFEFPTTVYTITEV
jgi:hypothetical protein